MVGVLTAIPLLVLALVTLCGAISSGSQDLLRLKAMDEMFSLHDADSNRLLDSYEQATMIMGSVAVADEGKETDHIRALLYSLLDADGDDNGIVELSEFVKYHRGSTESGRLNNDEAREKILKLFPDEKLLVYSLKGEPRVIYRTALFESIGMVYADGGLRELSKKYRLDELDDGNPDHEDVRRMMKLCEFAHQRLSSFLPDVGPLQAVSLLSEFEVYRDEESIEEGSGSGSDMLYMLLDTVNSTNAAGAGVDYEVHLARNRKLYAEPHLALLRVYRRDIMRTGEEFTPGFRDATDAAAAAAAAAATGDDDDDDAGRGERGWEELSEEEKQAKLLSPVAGMVVRVWIPVPLPPLLAPPPPRGWRLLLKVVGVCVGCGILLHSLNTLLNEFKNWLKDKFGGMKKKE